MDADILKNDFDQIISYCNSGKNNVDNIPELRKYISSIIIKAQEIKKNLPASPDIENANEIPDLSSFKIMICEDNSVNRMVAEAFMKKTGCIIEQAENGLEAVEKYRTSLKDGKPFDLILMDMQMPVMDGFSATTSIRQIEEEGKTHSLIIAMTGNVLDSEIKKAENCGTDDYITKPFPSKVLYEKCSKLLGVKSSVKTSSSTPASQSASSQNGNQKTNTYPDFSNLTILVVDDNKLNVEILNLMLKKVSARYEDAFDGTEALEKYLSSEEGKFDLILMDIQMPEMDGNTCAQKIRESGRKDSDVPIIAISANAFQEDKEKSLKSGINYHMSKPVEMKKLYEKISELKGTCAQ